MLDVYVFGLGAIGSNLLVQLALKYPDINFTGIDYDKVEERNIATQQYFIPHIGMPKIHALNVVLAMNLRKFNYKGINQKIESTGQISLLIGRSEYPILIIDCFDNTESRKIIHNYSNNVNILHIGFSPQYAAEITWDENYYIPPDIPADQNDICDMAEAVSFINFIVSLSCMSISNFIDNNIKNDTIIINKTIIKELR